MSNRTRDFERRTFLALASAGLAGLAGCNQQSQPGTTTPTSQPPTTDESEETETETTTTEPYDAERDIMVEMRDGVSLATNVFTPAGEDGPFPTLLNRTPYNKADEEPIGGIRPAVDAGYAVVQQDFRGRFGSEGEFQGFDQGEDGYDTIEWITEQDWSTGDVGMYGTSFRGMATWQAIKEDPPGLVAAAPLVTPTNFYGDLQYMGGADNYGTSLAWLAANSFSQVSRLDVSEEKAGELRGELESLLTGLPESADTLPTIEQPAFDEGVGPLWQDWHEHSTYDEFWKDLDVLQHIPDISTPVVQASGWYDIFLRGNTWGFSTIEEEGTDVVRENQKLVLGPWAHTTYPSANPVGDWDFGSNAEYDIANELVLPWFDYWLQDEETGVTSMPKVQYFQMGDNEWRTADQWPPSGVTATEYHLDSGGNANSDVGGGVLTTGDPSGSARSDSYEYDPLDPVPTRGGPLHMGGTVEAGVKDQTSVEERDDVLVYTSEELTEPLSIAGDVTASLFVETTAEDTDFMVKLVDVGPDGYSANITEGARPPRDPVKKPQHRPPPNPRGARPAPATVKRTTKARPTSLPNSRRRRSSNRGRSTNSKSNSETSRTRSSRGIGFASTSRAVTSRSRTATRTQRFPLQRRPSRTCRRRRRRSTTAQSALRASCSPFTSNGVVATLAQYHQNGAAGYASGW